MIKTAIRHMQSNTMRLNKDTLHYLIQCSACSICIWSLQVLKSAVLECLDRAHEKKAKSISFPTLGTGKLGYPSHVVADIMYNTISKWFHSHSDSCLKDVQIIVFSKDRQSMEVSQHFTHLSWLVKTKVSELMRERVGNAYGWYMCWCDFYVYIYMCVHVYMWWCYAYISIYVKIYIFVCRFMFLVRAKYFLFTLLCLTMLLLCDSEGF